MRFALVNPAWSFDGSIYFGCREPHLPLEFGYAKAMLQLNGHEAEIFDAPLEGLDTAALAEAVAAYGPDHTVVTTAPSYLFWRCPPPELRVPAALVRSLKGRGGSVVAVGPHGSTTPRPVLRKLGADLVLRGECEELILALARTGDRWKIPAAAFLEAGQLCITGAPHASGFVDNAPLSWPDEWVRRHRHHHHRFDAIPDGPGAEVEASRGCPYTCSFCAKLDFRDHYRRRRLDLLLTEIDHLIAQGATYLYFIDEIFLPRKELLEALAERPIAFGVQTRIDLWRHDVIDLLGQAGCVSIEAGLESITAAGRESLDKRCRMSTEALSERLIYARRRVPFVQANLIATEDDDPTEITAWRDRLREKGVWANDPVPLYPYPASPQYRRLWGEPDDQAWERAHAHYLRSFGQFSDIQDGRPLALETLEGACPP